MLCVCLPHQDRSTVYHFNRKVDSLNISNKTGLPRLVDAWPSFDCRRKAPLLNTDLLQSSETELRVDNLVVTNLQSNSMNRIAAILEI